MEATMEHQCAAPMEGGTCRARAVEYHADRGGWVCYEHAPKIYTLSTRHLELMAQGERHVPQAGAVRLDHTNRHLFEQWAGKVAGHEQN